MKTAIASLILTALASWSTGCTHYANMTRVENPADGTEVYESTRVDRHGIVRATVQERVEQSDDDCESVRVRKDYYSADGVLERRTVERRHCGYVVLRLQDTFDDGVHTRRLEVDRDEDGLFEHEVVRQDQKPAGYITLNHNAPKRN